MQAQPSRNWRTAVDAVAYAISSQRLSSGNLAELRRLTPHDALPPVFWHVLIRLVEPHDPGPSRDDWRSEWEKQWAVVLSGMATLAHNREEPLGSTLAATGFSETRFHRLLRARGTRLWDEVRLSVRFLSAKGAAIRWQDCAALVLFDSDTHSPWADRERRRLARDYYRTLYNIEKGASS